jgi:hypothetical protein
VRALGRLTVRGVARKFAGNAIFIAEGRAVLVAREEERAVGTAEEEEINIIVRRAGRREDLGDGN